MELTVSVLKTCKGRMNHRQQQQEEEVGRRTRPHFALWASRFVKFDDCVSVLFFFLFSSRLPYLLLLLFLIVDCRCWNTKYALKRLI